MTFERFTDRARRVVVLAQEQSRQLSHNYIGTEHLMLGLVVEGEGIAAMALHRLEVTPEAVRDQVVKLVGLGREDQVKAGHIPFTPRAKKVIELSLREALQLGHPYIGTEHLLLATLREGAGTGVRALERLEIEPTRVRQAVMAILLETGLSKSVVTPEVELLTDEEEKVIAAAGHLWDLICKAIPDGPTRDEDLRELVAPIHLIQRYFMGQAAVRAFPEKFRGLGESLR